MFPLYAGLRPVGRFIHRFEGSIEVLLHKGMVVSVPSDCHGVIPKLDGSLTLRQIQRRYGRSAVDWIGTLHQEDLVTWATRGRDFRSL